MKKQILIVLVLVVLTAFGRASETSQTVVAPGNSLFADSQESLTLLATADAASAGAPVSLVLTNVSVHKPVWDSTVAFGLTATAGNSDSALVTGNFQTHRKTPQDEWALGSDAAYGEVASVKNNETLHAFVQYNRLFSQGWYGYLRTDGLHDGIADVVYRITFSPGAGCYFIKDKPTSLAGETGPAVLYEKLDDKYHTYPVLRIAETLRTQIRCPCPDLAKCGVSASGQLPGIFWSMLKSASKPLLPKDFQPASLRARYYANCPHRDTKQRRKTGQRPGDQILRRQALQLPRIIRLPG